jgi:hypothetical protein
MFHHFGKVLEHIFLDLRTNSAQQYHYERHSNQHFVHAPACAITNTSRLSSVKDNRRTCSSQFLILDGHYWKQKYGNLPARMCPSISPFVRCVKVALNKRNLIQFRPMFSDWRPQLIYIINIFHTSERRDIELTRKIFRWTFYMEIMAIYCDSHMEKTNTLCGQK